MTGKEMCEEIAAELSRRTGLNVDPKGIWEMSPSGEIFPIVEMYWELFPDKRPVEWPTPDKGTDT